MCGSFCKFTKFSARENRYTALDLQHSRSRSPTITTAGLLSEISPGPSIRLHFRVALSAPLPPSTRASKWLTSPRPPASPMSFASCLSGTIVRADRGSTEADSNVLSLDLKTRIIFLGRDLLSPFVLVVDADVVLSAGRQLNATQRQAAAVAEVSETSPSSMPLYQILDLKTIFLQLGYDAEMLPVEAEEEAEPNSDADAAAQEEGAESANADENAPPKKVKPPPIVSQNAETVFDLLSDAAAADLASLTTALFIARNGFGEVRGNLTCVTECLPYVYGTTNPSMCPCFTPLCD